ncbi:MAG TPA: response regulator [Acidimicrobiales bacterium]|nr:response regulator [Acidimicrobiales bacterium]
MTEILVASDAEWVRDQVRSVLATADTRIRNVSAGARVLPAVRRRAPDLVILDFQIGNMGGIAVCLDLRLEESAARLDHIKVIMLLDRRADVFLARRSGAEGWLIRPLDPIRLRRASQQVLDGGTYYDESYKPNPVLVPPSGSITALGK